MITAMEEAKLLIIMQPQVEEMYQALRKIEIAWEKSNLENKNVKVAVMQGKLARLNYRDYLHDREVQEG